MLGGSAGLIEISESSSYNLQYDENLLEILEPPIEA